VLPEDSGAADVCNARINNFFLLCSSNYYIAQYYKKNLYEITKKKAPKAMP
jgi:hypothetical protein